MTTEQILREQIKELEKLIDLKNKTISELEIKLITPKLTFPNWGNPIPYNPGSTSPIRIDHTIPVCLHEFDYSVWPGTCKKCGYSNTVVTYGVNQATANRS